MSRWVGLLLCVALAACDVSGAEATPGLSAAPAEGAPTRGDAESAVRADSIDANNAGSVPAYRYAAPGRVVAVGDLHGDFQASVAVLRMAGLVNAELEWIGGNASLVQTGDQLDRGDDEAAILEFLQRLSKQAAAVGGQLVVLNGNHETMNVAGDYRYVTERGRTAFADISPVSPLATRAPAAMQPRAGAFLPGGALALQLAERKLIAVVGDSAFAHGGVLPAHVRYGVDRLNAEVQAWMRGGGRVPKWIQDPEGPVWTRQYGGALVPAVTCDALAWVLKHLRVERLVVGHTVQKAGVTSACGGRVFRIDVGLARYYGDNPVQALEITTNGVKVLKAATVTAN